MTLRDLIHCQTQTLPTAAAGAHCDRARLRLRLRRSYRPSRRRRRKALGLPLPRPAHARQGTHADARAAEISRRPRTLAAAAGGGTAPLPRDRRAGRRARRRPAATLRSAPPSDPRHAAQAFASRPPAAGRQQMRGGGDWLPGGPWPGLEKGPQREGRERRGRQEGGGAGRGAGGEEGDEMYIRQVGTRGPARRAGQVCEGGAAEGDAGPAAAGGSDVDLADGVWKVEPDRALVHLPPGRRRRRRDLGSEKEARWRQRGGTWRRWHGPRWAPGRPGPSVNRALEARRQPRGVRARCGRARVAGRLPGHVQGRPCTPPLVVSEHLVCPCRLVSGPAISRSSRRGEEPPGRLLAALARGETAGQAVAGAWTGGLRRRAGLKRALC